MLISGTCPGVKILELYPPYTGKILDYADSWLVVPANVPEELSGGIKRVKLKKRKRSVLRLNASFHFRPRVRWCLFVSNSYPISPASCRRKEAPRAFIHMPISAGLSIECSESPLDLIQVTSRHLQIGHRPTSKQAPAGSRNPARPARGSGGTGTISGNSRISIHATIKL